LLTLRREGQHLMAQVTGQPSLVVHAESETKFFWKVVDARFTMQKDKAGKVEGLLFEQGPVKLKAKKIFRIQRRTRPRELARLICRCVDGTGRYRGKKVSDLAR
jgi:hypothetical protein